MGRVGDNQTQSTAATQAQETNADSFPGNVPPPLAPSNNKPQAKREGEKEDEEDLYPIHHQGQRPVSFPPPNNEFELPNQQFHANSPASVHFPQPASPAQHGVQMVHPVVAQPLHVSGFIPAQVRQDKPWKSGLFDCMNDPENALITVCCPCITFGQIAEILDYGSTSCGTSGMLYCLIAWCFGIPCVISCGYRTKLRAKFELVESPAPDWLVHCCCELCALCQEYRQLKDMGYDPSIGWAGNEARMRHQLSTTPPTGQRMMM